MSAVVHSSNISTVQSSCSVSVMLSDNKTVIHRSRCNFERNIKLHCKSALERLKLLINNGCFYFVFVANISHKVHDLGV